MMDGERIYRAIIVSAVKHDYIARAVFAHPQMHVVAVADDDLDEEWVHERNQTLADEFGVPYCRDVGRALELFHADVAVVSSEAARHCDLAVRAVNAGLHLIVDKPLATRRDECQCLVDAIDEAGVASLVWNRNRIPSILTARKELQSKKIGQIRSIHCDFYFAKDAGPVQGSRKANDPPIDWLGRQLDAHADGSDGALGREPMGELQVEGIYPLAYLRELTDARVLRVFCRTATQFHQAHADGNVEDLASISLELGSEIDATICLGRVAAACHADMGSIRIHVIGSDGALVISEPSPEIAVSFRGQASTAPRHQRVGSEGDYWLVQELIDAIEGSGPTALDVRGGAEIFAVIEACLESASSGRVETVDPFPA